MPARKLQFRENAEIIFDARFRSIPLILINALNHSMKYLQFLDSTQSMR